MQARENLVWRERDLVAPDGERIHYFELSDEPAWLRVVRDAQGTTFALFSFPEGEDRERYVLVSPRRRGRVTFFLDRKHRRFDFAGDGGSLALDADLTPTDVAMLIQRRFAPIPA